LLSPQNSDPLHQRLSQLYFATKTQTCLTAGRDAKKIKLKRQNFVPLSLCGLSTKAAF
jgi:hypothetical protein